jgi:hypothetical protein
LFGHCLGSNFRSQSQPTTQLSSGGGRSTLRLRIPTCPANGCSAWKLLMPPWVTGRSLATMEHRARPSTNPRPADRRMARKWPTTAARANDAEAISPRVDVPSCGTPNCMCGWQCN